MSEETRESTVVYEDPIDIPLEEEDDEDEEEDDDRIANDEDGEDDDEDDEDDEDEVDDDVDEDGDDEGDEDVEVDEEVQVPDISRSATATPLSRPNTVGDDLDEPSPSSSQERFKKYPKLDPAKAPPGKKVPLHLLEKRRLGRIKAAEEFAKKLKQIGIEKIESNTLPPTGLFQPVLLINQKNYSSDYLKKDEQVFALRERKTIRNNTQVSTVNNTPDVADLKSGHTEPNDIINNPDDDIDLSDANTTIVIHPGSKFLKFGFAKDEHPMVIPSCTAIPRSEFGNKNIPQEPKITRSQSEDFEKRKSEIQQSFKDRMRYYKRKVQPNAREQVVSFNKASRPQVIDKKNDPEGVDWISKADKRYYGEQAARCSKEKFVVRYPFDNGGSFNVSSPYYSSLQDLLSDVIKLLEHAFSLKEFNLNPSQFSQFKVVLVIPDLFEKSHVEAFIRTLLTEMQFQAVAIIQESLATCYGAGLSSSTCVVNIGATQTSIACIDEGTVLENSLIKLNYGGDDITKLFAIFLLQNEFPYQNWDITSSHGWQLAEQLKKDYITFQDANVTVQLYNFIKRIPGATSEKYEFKVFDEVMLAPLALSYPEIISSLQLTSKLQGGNAITETQLPISRDIFTESLNDWRSLSQNDCLDGSLYCGNNNDLEIMTRILDLPAKVEEFQNKPPMDADFRKNYTPLEKAIVQSITNASIPLDITKMPSFYSNILVVGGGSNIPALDFILTDRINIWRPRLLSVTTFSNFYKKVLKQMKDMKANGKTGTPEEEAETDKSIEAMIKDELQKYWEGVDAQNGNEHLLPVSVLPPPRDMDPSVLIWKGASVLAQIKLVEELFLTSTDWDIHGSRILQYKCLFTY